MRLSPFQMMGSSAATVFGIKVFGLPENCWYRRPVQWLHRHVFAIQRYYHSLIRRFIRRDHIIKLPIAGEWCDSDERMFLACFETLGYFVNQELGPPYKDGTQYRGFRLHSCGGHDEQAIDLWLWYRDELPKLQADYDRDLQECYSGRMQTAPAGNGLVKITSFGRVREPKFPYGYPEQVKDEKLRELIELRTALWT